MPATSEIRCTNQACYLDMWENHFTYDLPDDHDTIDLSCPVCERTDCLESIDV